MRSFESGFSQDRNTEKLTNEAEAVTNVALSSVFDSGDDLNNAVLTFVDSI